MLTPEDNATITQVGPGTPMGELLRRYWQPVAAVSELEDNPVKALRLMGEDLVLYRDRSGTYGLIERHCPHRRADMSYGMVEECGIRCAYHGWRFDEAGRCLEQPFEEVAHPEARFKDRVSMRAYKVEAKAGLLWAYLGPEPSPLVPNWEPFTWDNGFVQVVFSEVPCSWLQGQENSIDPVHFEWLHGNWGAYLRNENGARPPTHLKLAFDEFEYGFTYRRVVEGQSEDDELWTVGRVCLWPNALFVGEHFEWRVPIDDENMLSVGWFFTAVPESNRPYVQERVPYWYAPVKDESTGRWITSHVMNQDFVAWVGQGRISDREHEHLGESDRGVIMLRRKLLEQAALVQDGGEPIGLIRDESANACVVLPIVNREGLKSGETFAAQQSIGRPEVLSASQPIPAIEGFAFLAGQPQDVRREFERVMGLS